MATPNYKGAGQPQADGGSWLGSWLGGTPAYKGAMKSTSNASGFSSSGPAYKPAPAPADSSALTTTADQSDACGGRPIAIVIPREVIDQQ
jgi:hypothetical protein